MANDDIDKAADKVMNTVDKLGDPDNMTKTEYKEFLENCISRLESNLDCVKQELEEEGDEE